MSYPIRPRVLVRSSHWDSNPGLGLERPTGLPDGVCPLPYESSNDPVLTSGRVRPPHGRRVRSDRSPYRLTTTTSRPSRTTVSRNGTELLPVLNELCSPSNGPSRSRTCVLSGRSRAFCPLNYRSTTGTDGVEPSVSGFEGRRRIHWTTHPRTLSLARAGSNHHRRHVRAPSCHWNTGQQSGPR